MKKKMIALLLSGIMLLGSTAMAQEVIGGEDLLSSEEELIIEEYVPDEKPAERIELVDGETVDPQMLADGTVDQEPELLSVEADLEKGLMAAWPVRYTGHIRIWFRQETRRPITATLMVTEPGRRS